MLLSLTAICVACLSFPAIAEAAKVRYHYVPAACTDALQLAPAAGGSPGERLSWVGRTPTPYNCTPRPNQVVCFLHPTTNRYVKVPLELPPDTPRIEHVYLGTMYNYGSESVEIRFLADGSVDVLYSNGLLRRP
jgi:hypothetical protein